MEKKFWSEFHLFQIMLPLVTRLLSSHHAPYHICHQESTYSLAVMAGAIVVATVSCVKVCVLNEICQTKTYMFLSFWQQYFLNIWTTSCLVIGWEKCMHLVCFANPFTENRRRTQKEFFMEITFERSGKNWLWNNKTRPVEKYSDVYGTF